MTKEKRIETVAFRVTNSLYSSLQELTAKERRKLSEVALALLERGLAAYQRDGQLFEPADEGEK
jgi:hypothetical protein